MSEIGRKHEKVLYFNTEKDWETNCDVLITDRDDLVKHGQDIVIGRVEIRWVGRGAHQVEVVLNKMEFAFH